MLPGKKAFHRGLRTWNFFRNDSALLRYVPRGHFYSPLPDLSEASEIALKATERSTTDEMSAIDLRTDDQRALLLRIADLYADFDWPEQRVPERRFHFDQGWYKQADSICLYSMLRIFRPQSVIEVGSGFSSALMLDVRDRFLGNHTRLTFIEPHPERLESLLAKNDEKTVRIIRQPVQSAPRDVFAELTDGDFLLIDSSHVSKVGSDVNFLLFEIVPRLPMGSFVHFHDVFWPFEYPPEWIRQGTAWNEAYILRAFLSFNTSFEIVLWVPFCARCWPEIIKERMPLYMVDTGGSIWIRRVR